MKPTRSPGARTPRPTAPPPVAPPAETVDSVTARILQLIQARALQPGNRLPAERELAQTLGVSRPALRESLAALEATRLIVRRPNSGIYLAASDRPPSFESVVLRSDLGLPLEAGTVADSLEVRQVLEVQAVALACARRTDEDLERLRAVLELTRQCLAEARSIIDLDEAFHLGIVAATRNPVYLQVVSAFYRLSIPRREAYFADLARCRRSYREHRAILAAIDARDAAAARRVMQRHVETGLRAVVGAAAA